MFSYSATKRMAWASSLAYFIFTVSIYRALQAARMHHCRASVNAYHALSCTYFSTAISTAAAMSQFFSSSTRAVLIGSDSDRIPDSDGALRRRLSTGIAERSITSRRSTVHPLSVLSVCRIGSRQQQQPLPAIICAVGKYAGKRLLSG